MELTKDYLQACETLIAKGKTAEVLDQLMLAKDSTAYKNEILSLSSRFKQLDRDKMAGTLSSEEATLKSSRLSKDVLTLLEAMGRELAGEKIEKQLFPSHGFSARGYHPLYQTYIPVLLTAIAACVACYFAFRQPLTDCLDTINLHGDWEVFSNAPDIAEKKLGTANITQNDCENSFQLSGALVSFVAKKGAEVDFSSKIAGISGKELFFIYENFGSEMGICRGIPPSGEQTEFTVTCTDLIGYDKDGEPITYFRFRKQGG